MSKNGDRIIKSKGSINLRIVSLFIIFVSLAFITSLVNLNINANLESGTYIENGDSQIPDLNTQDLNSDNSFTGLGSAWNVTHYANYTKSNLGVSFNNNSYDDSHAQVELYEWNGYQLNSTITNLYDTRNWINGTFNAGFFGGSPSGSDDSEYINDWTFKTSDIQGYINTMSGNYYDGSTSTSDFESSLELRINADGSGRYDVGDKCWWENTIEIDRGDVDEAWLSFAVRPKYGDAYNNHMVLQVLVNNKIVWGNGLQSMIDASGNSNGQWYNPYPIYLDGNDHQLFPTGLKNMNVTIEFKRVSGTASGYASSYSVLFDNVSLIVKAKAKPTQLELELNNEYVNDNSNYGEGNLGILGNWNGSLQSTVIANYSSNAKWSYKYQDNGNWISYKVELIASLNLFTTKSRPETYYTADSNLQYQGSSFITSNSSNVNWTTYAHMEIPAGYEETNMTVEYPSDYSLTGVFFSLNPNSLSQSSIKEYGSKQVVNIPVSSITSNTNGFWRLTADSPNYCKELNIYNNNSGDWELNNEFLSGDYINITGRINNSLLISGYIQQTKAQLQIRFPTGTIWSAQTQIKPVDDAGMVFFDPIMIPDDVPNYEPGEYEVIITWNNSYSLFNSNETGVIYKKFIVIHESLLYPDQGIYFIENVLDDRIINIKVTFNDLVDGTAIDYALVYTDFTGTIETLDRISPGFYLYEFNATKANAGNNTVTIYANSTYYSPKTINITVEVIKQTILTVQTDFFTVPWKQNFTVRFNYTEKNNPQIGIDTTDITIDEWLGDYHLTQPSIGQYVLQCNTSAYAALTLQSFIISINPYKYEPQSVLIRVSITELESSLTLNLDGKLKADKDTIQVQANEFINVTVYFQDNITKQYLRGANVTLKGGGLDLSLTEISNQYNITLDTNDLDPGITVLTVFARLDNYKSKSIQFFVEIVDRETDLLLFLDGVPKNDGDKIQVEVNEFINVTVYYRDNETKLLLGGATITLIGRGDFSETSSHYNRTIDTNDLDQGITVLTIFAQLDKFQPQSIQFFVEVVERESELQLFVDNDDITLDPVIEVTIGSILNITVFYTDNQTESPIIGALVQLIGEGETLNFSAYFNHYSIYLNTVDLKVGGVSLFTIVAHANNFQIRTIDLRITTNRIKITPSTLSGEPIITGSEGGTVHLIIILNNTNVLPSGELIENATVTYKWDYGQGPFYETNGIYEADLVNVPSGTYIITITASSVIDDYTFETYEITLTVGTVTPPDFSMLFIILAGALVALVSIFTLYEVRFKYPPLVRKSRKLRKKIKKGRKTKPFVVNNREETIRLKIEDQTKIFDKDSIEKSIDKISKN